MAIVIKENADQYIAKVEHRNGRIATMRIKTKIQGQTLIIIIHSHAPDMNIAVETRKEYWGRIKQIPNRIKKKDIVIGATDNNDQVRRNTEHENKTIGNGPHPKKIANRKGETS